MRALVVVAFAEVSEEMRLLVGNVAAVGIDKMAAQLFLPREQATAWVRQLLVQRIGFVAVAARRIAQHRLLVQGLMFAAPAVAQRAAAARAGGPGAHVFSLQAVLANGQPGGARHCGDWAMALGRSWCGVY